LLKSIVRMIHRKCFRDDSKRNENDFTRERKIGFVSLIYIIMRMIRKSTQLELDEFREKFMEESAKTTSYTKQSFSEARQKLNPVAFTLLNDEYVRRFYEDGDFRTYKGFRLLAEDGSVLQLPNTKETQKTYGYASTGDKNAKLARALSTHLYDLENKIVISTTLGRYDDSERNLAKQDIEKLLSLEELSNARNLILFDRGYPSADLIQYLEKKEIYYLMRTNANFYKEVNETTTPDEIVQIEITSERAKRLEKQGTPIPKGTILKVRVLKVELSTGESETLITNLTRDELTYEESKALYFKRWGIETRFNELKHKFEVENFSGEKPIIIEQDYYATVLLGNIASVLEQGAEEELQEKNQHKTLKYTEYRINKNILIGKLKNRLIEILLEEDDQKKDLLYERFVEELQRNVLPVVKNRNFKRKKQSRSNRYANAKRRCL
jgi:IS4 transposase